MNIQGRDFRSHHRQYRITPIQSPIRSAAFEGQLLSRLPLAPPLILQMDCWDPKGELMIPYDELPFLICHLALETPDGRDASMVFAPTGQAVQMLYGTLVAAPAEMDDMTGGAGVYFVFPDVSVRFVGRFRLKAMLMRITGGPAINVCVTPTFEIVHHRDYIAPPLTPLTRHFNNQNVVRFGLPRWS